MASVVPTHDNLPTGYPDAVAIKCDGGLITVTYLGEQPMRYGSCPACDYQKLRAAVSAFIPQRFRKPVALPAELTAWAERGRRAQGMYITGPVGTGKTHAAWTALGVWCLATGTRPRGAGYDDMTNKRTRPSVVFTRLVDLLDDLRPGEIARQAVRDCQEAGLLVIDDLGAEKASEWTQERLYSIVDHRYASCLPLIVTSNLPTEALTPQTGERTASRLAEMCEHVAMTGEDRRWQP